MFKSFWFVIASLLCSSLIAQPSLKHNLHFNALATTWDEGIPLGNATLGALVWQKEGQLRFSLDRSDLWDLRPMKGLDEPEFSYQWITEHVKNKDYRIVQQKLDEPYEKEPAPSKIPGAALMIDTRGWGDVAFVDLNIATALCTVKWKNGTTIESYVHADKPVGWVRISNLKGKFLPRIEPPAYQSHTVSGSGSVEGDDLNRLGYTQGNVSTATNSITYEQMGWNGFRYTVHVNYKKINSRTVECSWTISTNEKNFAAGNTAFQQDLISHMAWWKRFWSKSAISIPNEQLEKQWYLEMYKFGSAARADAPPISLQAVWTADNGRLPPWKGDFHHDLNTQLSSGLHTAVIILKKESDI